MSENQSEREVWDTGEPEARSHEQYRAPEQEEVQPTEVGPGNPPLVSEEEPDKSDDSSETPAASDADNSQDATSDQVAGEEPSGSDSSEDSSPS